MKPWLFISDLHLSAERPTIIDLFIRFTREIAPQAQRLYILGDLVEYWIGDDAEYPGIQPAFDAIKHLSERGTEVFFMHGNRDFLLGEQCADHYGFKLLDEPHLTHFDNTPVLLMHGDSLCVDDTDYQQFKRMVRHPEWQREFLAKPVAEREAIALTMRTKSKQLNSLKDEYIMDVNVQAVIDTMHRHHTQLLIHGHTHRPAIHELMLDDKTAKRVVLADWYETGGYLLLEDAGDLQLREFG